MIDPNYKIDARKLNYQEPKTNVEWLVQQPAYKIDGYALANAVMSDWREAKKKQENSHK